MANNETDINLWLSSLNEGALQQQFEAEMEKVIDNIADLNTEYKPKRSVTITLTIEPDERRDITGMSIEVKSKLAPQKATSTRIVIDRDFQTGKVSASEMVSNVRGQTRFDPATGEIQTDTGRSIDEIEKEEAATTQKEQETIIDFRQQNG